MKTYIFDTLNRFLRYSEELDFSTTLCNKTWWVFNDNGDKAIYIFQPQGNLYVTTNGKGIKGSWSFIPANKSLIVEYQEEVLMFHPSFVDNVILALNLDGTNTYSFLIDEENRGDFAPKSLKDLTIYFEEKERKAIELQQRLEYENKLRAAENEKQIAQARLDAERARTATLELEAKNQVELERQIANERKRQEEEEKRKKNQKKVELSVKERRKLEHEAAKVVKSAEGNVFLGILFLAASFWSICAILYFKDLQIRVLLVVIGVVTLICSITFFISYSSTKKELIKKYKEEHSPDDPLIEYLDKV